MTELSRAIAVKPIITYPREAQVGKTYLMTIDLQPEEGFEWQYEEEEYPIYCTVDSELFSSKPVGEPVVVIHRFGGSYGEAQFLLTALQKDSACELQIVLLNKWGTLIRKLCLNGVQIIENVFDSRQTFLNDSWLTSKRTSRNNLETLDKKLRRLISELKENPSGSIARRQARATNRFLIEVQRLPGIVRSNHQDYLAALNQTLLWLVDSIDNFAIDTPSIQADLPKWINSYLQYKIKDLFSPNMNRVRQKLNETFTDEEDEEAFLEELDKIGVFDSVLEAAEEQQALLLEQTKSQGLQVEIRELQEYIKLDPDGNLRGIHIRGNPRCNAQLLIQKRIFQEKSLIELSQELGISVPSLSSFWARQVAPRLREIGERFLT